MPTCGVQGYKKHQKQQQLIYHLLLLPLLLLRHCVLELLTRCHASSPYYRPWQVTCWGESCWTGRLGYYWSSSAFSVLLYAGCKVKPVALQPVHQHRSEAQAASWPAEMASPGLVYIELPAACLYVHALP